MTGQFNQNQQPNQFMQEQQPQSQAIPQQPQVQQWGQNQWGNQQHQHQRRQPQQAGFGQNLSDMLSGGIGGSPIGSLVINGLAKTLGSLFGGQQQQLDYIENHGENRIERTPYPHDYQRQQPIQQQQQQNQPVYAPTYKDL